MSNWKCKYCGEVSDTDTVSDADGVCRFHPAGVGNHHFAEVTMDINEIVEQIHAYIGSDSAVIIDPQPTVNKRGFPDIRGSRAFLGADIIALADDHTALKAWKESALSVEQEWDVQALTKMLGGQLGESCRKVIAEKVPLLIAENAALKERLAAAEASFSTIVYRIMRVRTHNDSTCEACANDKKQIYKIASDAVAALQGEGDK